MQPAAGGQGIPLPHKAHPSRNGCLLSVTITMLVASVLAMVVGTLALLIALQNPFVTQAIGSSLLGNVGMSHSYILIVGGAFLASFATAASIQLLARAIVD